MPIDPRDESNASADASLAAAYDDSLPLSHQKLIRQHLSFLLTRWQGQNAYIAPARQAVLAMDARFAARRNWYEKPLGIIFLMVIGSFIAGILVVATGYKLRINGTDAPAATGPALTLQKAK